MKINFNFVLLLVLLGNLSGCFYIPPTQVKYGIKDPTGQYPPCPKGVDSKYWNNCYGFTYIKGISLSGVYKNGVNSERVLLKNPSEGEECIADGNKNYKKEVKEVCVIHGVKSTRFWLNGERDYEKEKAFATQGLQNECKSLGFKDNTSEMGNCILRLRELNKSNHPVQIAQPTPTQPTTADKLDALSQVLQGVQMMSGGATRSSSPTSVGITCPKSSEYMSGIYRVCVYNCAGGSTTKTVQGVQLCPLSATF